jgi:hypothetical protein
MCYATAMYDVMLFCDVLCRAELSCMVPVLAHMHTTNQHGFPSAWWSKHENAFPRASDALAAAVAAAVAPPGRQFGGVSSLL